MKHEFEYVVKGELSTENITDILSCESGGFDYWAEIQYEEEDYFKAKENLINKGSLTDDICYEDVLTEMIESKLPVIIYDIEENKPYMLSLNKLINGVKLNCINRPDDCNIENMDSITADCIIQYAIFEEVIYG